MNLKQADGFQESISLFKEKNNISDPLCWELRIF